MFDETLPRLQDYDLLLRMTPNIRVSYTNEILVELYQQNNSISLSKDKLEKAKDIIMKKNYGFNSTQMKFFINSLNDTV